jgi:hypothetical protein
METEAGQAAGAPGISVGSRVGDVLSGAACGAIGAMAMTGMRVLTTELGLVEQTPPETLSVQRARGVRALLRRAPRKQRRGLLEGPPTGLRCPRWRNVRRAAACGSAPTCSRGAKHRTREQYSMRRPPTPEGAQPSERRTANHRTRGLSAERSAARRPVPPTSGRQSAVGIYLRRARGAARTLSPAP